MVEPSEFVLVIGYGNPQRGDDGVAWKVLDALRAAQPRPEVPPLRLKHVHQLSPQAVLLYAERLYGHVPRAALVVGGMSFEHGEELSPEALQAIPNAARRIRSLARLWARQPLPEPAGA